MATEGVGPSRCSLTGEKQGDAWAGPEPQRTPHSSSGPQLQLLTRTATSTWFVTGKVPIHGHLLPTFLPITLLGSL